MRCALAEYNNSAIRRDHRRGMRENSLQVFFAHRVKHTRAAAALHKPENGLGRVLQSGRKPRACVIFPRCLPASDGFQSHVLMTTFLGPPPPLSVSRISVVAALILARVAGSFNLTLAPSIPPPWPIVEAMMTQLYYLTQNRDIDPWLRQRRAPVLH